MNKHELEKMKNLIYFIEKYLNINLTSWQKELIKSYHNNEKPYIFHCRSGRKYFGYVASENKKGGD